MSYGQNQYALTLCDVRDREGKALEDEATHAYP
jgi:hypothetical protein